MKIIQSLLFSMVLLSVGTAGAVTVSMTGNGVGAEGTYTYNGNEYTYWAGIVEINIDGSSYLAMPALPFLSSVTDDPTLGMADMNFYTRDDILAGGIDIDLGWGSPIVPEAYARASRFFLDGLLGYQPADPLWAASFNEMIWQTMPNDVLSGGAGDYFDNANTVYDAASGVRLRDVYNTMLSEGLDPNYDYSGFMGVLSIGFINDLFVFTSPVPVPPALWLFSSGLIGFVAVAKRKRSP